MPTPKASAMPPSRRSPFWPESLVDWRPPWQLHGDEYGWPRPRCKRLARRRSACCPSSHASCLALQPQWPWSTVRCQQFADLSPTRPPTLRHAAVSCKVTCTLRATDAGSLAHQVYPYWAPEQPAFCAPGIEHPDMGHLLTVTPSQQRAVGGRNWLPALFPASPPNTWSSGRLWPLTLGYNQQSPKGTTRVPPIHVRGASLSVPGAAFWSLTHHSQPPAHLPTPEFLLGASQQCCRPCRTNGKKWALLHLLSTFRNIKTNLSHEHLLFIYKVNIVSYRCNHEHSTSTCCSVMFDKYIKFTVFPTAQAFETRIALRVTSTFWGDVCRLLCVCVLLMCVNFAKLERWKCDH